MNVQARQQPITDKGAQQTDYQIPYQPEALASHHLPRKPTGDDPNQNNDQKVLIRQIHGSFSQIGNTGCRSPELRLRQ
jgi:hypothetical protein